MAGLTIQSEGGEEKFALDSPSVVLGRGLESDIRLKDIKASRQHCRVVKADEGYRLVDLGSGNGTYVNGILVERDQPLRNGDKIQIGTTVILFADGGATSGAKVPTQSVGATDQERKRAASPTSRVPAAVPTRATVKGAPPQTAVTKKMDRAAAAKPMATKVSATSRVTTRRGTAKVPGATTRTTARVSMTERFAQEAGKKKVNPLVFVLAGAGVVIVGVVVLLFVGIGGGNDLPTDQKKIKGLTGDGAKLISEGKFDEGIQKYREAMALCDKHPKELGQSKSAIQAEISEAENGKAARLKAAEAWEAVQSEYKGNKYEIKEFRERVRTTRDDHVFLNMPWTRSESQDPLENIQVMFEKLDNEYNTWIATQRRQDFQYKRQEILEKFKLKKAGEADFAGALREWGKYLGEVQNSDAKNKAQNEIVDIHRQSFAAWTDLKRKADGMGKEEALALLDAALPRFAGCKFDNGETVTDIEQEMRNKVEELRRG